MILGGPERPPFFCVEDRGQRLRDDRWIYASDNAGQSAASARLVGRVASTPSRRATASMSAPRSMIGQSPGASALNATTAFFGQSLRQPVSTTPKAALRPFFPLLRRRSALA